ncbi:MAG: Rieske (2Fe-2S) protein [Gammaproteobacteria bacterium]
MTADISSSQDTAWHEVAATSDFTDGSMRGYTVQGREVVVCRTREGQWHALDNICTHGFVKMHEGRLRGVRLICPLHGASFDCRNGSVLGAPATKPLACWQVRVEADRVWVALPAA